MRILRRLLTIIGICLLALVQTVVAAETAGTQCIETCPDDDQDGRCPPACTCACHAPRKPVPAGVVEFVAPAPPGARRCPVDVEVPTSPEQSEIWHVPKVCLT
jgi:hypothetical protein